MRNSKRGRVLTAEDELRVGDVFIVKRFNGTEDERMVATLIQTKEVCDRGLAENRDEKRVKRLRQQSQEPDARGEGTPTPMDASELETEPSPVKRMHKLFYIHYEGMDRRLDEWVERERFVERATQADALIVPSKTPAAGPASAATTPSAVGGTLTRSQRRIHEEFHHVQRSYQDMDATTARLEREHEERTKVKYVETVRLGRHEISTWYFSPFPDELQRYTRVLFCEYCLYYTVHADELAHHTAHECSVREPPGYEIYRKGNVSVYEGDGRSNKMYCQCLCLLSKLFMDHKTLYFDVETFLFYVLTEVDEYGAHIVGHFSKERMSDNNLACIMILPPYQRKGYGKLLIQLSYELSSRENWIGTPEKPLSDLGKVSYRSYWWWVLLDCMDENKVEDITVDDLSLMSGIAAEDIVSTLQTMQLVKSWKGEHVVRATRRVIEHCKGLNMGQPPRLRLDPAALRWQPRFVRGSPRGSQD